MPPEQVLGQAEPASDSHALGVTCVCVAACAAPDALPFDRRGGRIGIQRIEALPARLRPLIADLTHPALDRRCGDAATARERLRTARTAPPARPKTEKSRAPTAPAPSPRPAPAPSPVPAIAPSSTASGPSRRAGPPSRGSRYPLSRVVPFVVLCRGMATLLVSGLVGSGVMAALGFGASVGGLVWLLRVAVVERRNSEKPTNRRDRSLRDRRAFARANGRPSVSRPVELPAPRAHLRLPARADDHADVLGGRPPRFTCPSRRRPSAFASTRG